LRIAPKLRFASRFEQGLGLVVGQFVVAEGKARCAGCRAGCW
jgi:hypothetical protein